MGLAGLLLAGCQAPDSAVPALPVPGRYAAGQFPAPRRTPWRPMPPDAATFALGRSLFYDPRLSRDGSVSCGSCHQQFVAFANEGHRLSHGVAGRLGTRNAPALQNLRWKPNFFWDGGPNNLETLPLAPLTNPLEMDETLTNVLRKLNADPTYTRRFAAVYGPGPIDSYQFLRALAQFTAALTSANSRYDHYVRGEAGGHAHSAPSCAAGRWWRKSAPAATPPTCSPTNRSATTASNASSGPIRGGRTSPGAPPTWAASRCPACATWPSRRLTCTTAALPPCGPGAGPLRPRRAALPYPRRGPAAGRGRAGHSAHGRRSRPTSSPSCNTLTDDAFIHDQRLAEQP